jgi:hypothetical protein
MKSTSISSLGSFALVAKNAYQLRRIRPSLSDRMHQRDSHWTDFFENS